jgi:uncharacterized membrane protein YesL
MNFQGFFDPDNKLWSALSRFLDILLINVLTVLCSVPVITAGAAFSAGWRDMMKVTAGAQTYTIKGYFTAFRDNFKKATLLWLIVLAAGLVTAGDIYFTFTVEANTAVYVLRYLFYVVAILVAFVCLWVFPLTVTFENTIPETLKNALLMSIRHLPWTFLMLLIWAAPWLMVFLTNMALLPYVATFMIFFGFGLEIFICSFIFRHLFKNYMPDDSSGDENEDAG